MAFDPAHVSSLLEEPHRLTRQPAIVRGKARRYVEDYAKSSCVSLCTEMQARLPRELRDMVYAFLLEDAMDFHIGVRLDDLPGVLKSHPHVRDIAYLGQETVAELAKEWYHHCAFRLKRGSLILFLFNTEENIWHLPDLNLFEHVHHVYVDIARIYQPLGIFQFSPFETDMPIDFEQLFMLQRPATLTIELKNENLVIFSRKDPVQDMPYIDQLSKRVFPVLTGLVGAGVKVAAMIDRNKRLARHVSLEDLSFRQWSRLVRQILLQGVLTKGSLRGGL